jgi:hypothetical protein
MLTGEQSEIKSLRDKNKELIRYVVFLEERIVEISKNNYALVQDLEERLREYRPRKE